MRTGAAAVALGAIPGKPAWGAVLPSADHGKLDALALYADADLMRSLAMRAVDTARQAGAVYADVRLTRIVEQSFDHAGDRVVGADVRDKESFAIGVRALVNGYWGFAASPYWNAEEVHILARDAVHQAKTNALGTPRQVDLAPTSAATGSWITPGIDPLTITVEEKLDFINGWRQAVNDAPKQGMAVALDRTRMIFSRQERFTASTEGTAIMQIFYGAGGKFPFSVGPSDWRAQRDGKGAGTAASGLQMQRSGWNVMLDAKVRDQIPGLIENAREMLTVPRKAVDIGRFDVVFDAAATSGILAGTLGIATQLDRALGYEANAGGTSYLGPDPLELLGTMHVAAPMVSVTGNRSLPAGCATVKWDDEGVVPEEFTLVKNGVLVDYQTTREQAAWLKPWYDKQQQPIRSHACSTAVSALDNPIQLQPNFAMTPSSTAATFESLVAGTTKGLAIMGGWASTDFQGRTGTGSGLVREIVNGKLGPICTRAGFLFGANELWKNVTAIGDATSVRHVTSGDYKGQPGQEILFTVSSVPMAVKNVSIIDMSRRA